MKKIKIFCLLFLGLTSLSSCEFSFGGSSSSNLETSSESSYETNISSSNMTSSESSAEQVSSNSSNLVTSSSSQSSNSSSSIKDEIKFSCEGSFNSILVNQIPDTNYKLYYKLSSEDDSKYKLVDSQLINKVDNEISGIILGLKQGSYDVKLTDSKASKIGYVKNVQVQKYDQSGYASFKNSAGVGGYNLDGTIKTNAKIIYVDDSNKNSVEYNGKKGLANILNDTKRKVPLIVRIVGSIHTNQLKYKKFEPIKDDEDINSSKYKDMFTNEYETTYTNLDGLTSTLKGCKENPNPDNGIKFSEAETKNGYYDTDSGFNNMYIQNVENITIEGVSKDATIHQWGMTFKRCSSIEVRNLTFSDYTEDACAFEGDSNDVSKYKYFFFHHNTINIGKNNWDVTYEQDKADGDGGNDIKYISNYTSAYNHFVKTHKTGLIGGSDSQLTANVTMHHNYYDQCSSRLPLGRQANMHIYNNYYYKCGTCQDIRANAYVLSEYNYFETCKKPQLTSSSAVIKSYNDVFNKCDNESKANIVTSRDKTVSNKNNPLGDGDKNFQKFDTNSDYFYYDSSKKVSDVEILTANKDVPSYVTSHSGSIFNIVL